MYSKKEVHQLLEILLSQDFDSVIKSTQDALRVIDPSWKKGQFKVFSRNFRLQFFKSLFTERVLLNDLKFTQLEESKLLETILLFSQNMDEMEKAAFYGSALSEYVLLCPIERFPAWAEEEKSKPNWLAHWNLHADVWYAIYK